MGRRTDKTSAGPLQVEFICPKCNTRLAWALPSASILCPACGRWVTDANRKHLFPAELYMPLDSDQLVLFKEGE